MPNPVPIDPPLVAAASEAHRRLTGWGRSDEALAAVRDGLPGFGPGETLAKISVVNALYATNVFALVRVAEHFATVLTRQDLRAAGPELVEVMARVPQGGGEKRPIRRLSLAAKFAHFFVNEDRFPIYDRFAVRMVAHHAGVAVARLEGNFTAFSSAFDVLAGSWARPHSGGGWISTFGFRASI
jgi:hypothetical protein